MPRDGSGIYSRPPGTDGAPDTTIESAKYNAFVADIEQDANTARPIIAGGTGANNARDAMVTLKGEITQQLVDNYDMYPFISGSFYSTTGATASPVAGHGFVGICYAADTNNMVLEARDQTDTVVPGRKYAREKKSGVWGAWKVDGRTIVGDAEGIGSEAADMFFGVEGTAPASAFIVNSESDNSGTDLLRVTKAGAFEVRGVPGGYTVVGLHKSAIGMGTGITGYDPTGKARWLMYMGDGSAESGANAGSNFEVHRYDDAGTYLGRAMQIERSTGKTAVGPLDVGGDIRGTGHVRVNNDVTLGMGVAAGGVVYFGNTGAQRIAHDGTQFQVYGGDFKINTNAIVGAQLRVGANGADGVIRFTSGAGDPYIYYNGNFNFNGGDVYTGSRFISNSDIHCNSSLAFGPVGTVKYMQLTGSNLNIYNMVVSPNAGLTMTGGQILPVYNATGIAAGAGNAGLEVRSSGSNDAWVSFHRTGVFATNFGLSSDHNLWLGGWSFGAVAYKVLTTREVGAVVSSFRTVYAGDFEHVYQNGMQEPYGSTAAVSGCQQGNGIATFRYRYHQMLQNGAWANIEAS
jgi:hypothetical protein